MEVPASPPLALFTTFHLGGPAHAFIEAQSEEEVKTAIALAREGGLPLYVLGAGSNVLVNDSGVEGVVVHMMIRGIAIENTDEAVVLTAGAGTLWEEVVDAACAHGVFGIENLAGIPGTLGGAAVQNIGAYGAEFSSAFAYADVIDNTTGELRRVSRPEVTFAYRDSFLQRASRIHHHACRTSSSKKDTTEHRLCRYRSRTSRRRIARYSARNRSGSAPHSCKQVPVYEWRGNGRILLQESCHLA